MAFNNEVSRIGIDVNLPDGATHDLLLVSTDGGYPTGQLTFKIEDAPRKITGIQKVAQLFLKVLFSQKGTDLLRPNHGTDFPNLAIGANRTRDDSDFIARVTDTITDAESQTRNISWNSSKDLSSQLDRIIIIGISTETIENLEMYLQLVTRAGEKASIAVPFPDFEIALANG